MAFRNYVVQDINVKLRVYLKKKQTLVCVERRFFNPKMVKIYLRNIMSQQKLGKPATIAIVIFDRFE